MGQNLESDGLAQNTDHNTSAGNEETNEEHSKHPFDSTIEEATEGTQGNYDVTQTDGRETTLEVPNTTRTREGNENKLTGSFVMTEKVN